jgi:hypothetical protein
MDVMIRCLAPGETVFVVRDCLHSGRLSSLCETVFIVGTVFILEDCLHCGGLHCVRLSSFWETLYCGGPSSLLETIHCVRLSSLLETVFILGDLS